MNFIILFIKERNKKMNKFFNILRKPWTKIHIKVFLICIICGATIIYLLLIISQQTASLFYLKSNLFFVLIFFNV